jgi:hypothetical protein
MQDRPSVFARFLGRPPKALDWVVLASLLTVVSMILACAVCVIGPDILFHRGTTPTSYQAGDLATVTAVDTATPTTPPVKPPSIGAPYSAFAATFSSRLNAKSWQVQIAGQAAVLDVIQEAGTDGQQRITHVAISPLPVDYGRVTYPPEAVVAYIEQFLPADADETGTKTEIDGSVTHLFHSASLVPLLPARAYLFGQPGDLFWNCVPVHSRTGIDSCVVGLE